MILAHSIVGITAGNYFGNFYYVLLGSIMADIDHILILFKYRLFTLDKVIQSMRFEQKYGIRFKTKYFHSFFGAFFLSLPLLLFDFKGGLYFLMAYIFHLLLDFFDYDEKQYLFPFKKIFRGFLPIFSKQEIFFTFFLFFLMVLSFYYK